MKEYEFNTAKKGDAIKAKETELLRNDTKSLLWSLKKHQDSIYESLNKFKEIDQSLDDQISDLTSEDEIRVPRAKETIKIKSSKSFKTPKKSKSPVKTVSFSDYLRTCSTSGKGLVISPRRRSRSASPFSKKSPGKSILKKQIVQDELSDKSDDEMEKKILPRGASYSSSSESISTNSLLSCNIYGDFNTVDDLDDNLRAMNRYRANEPSGQDKSKIINHITKQRESYLNHKYNEKSLSNSSLVFNEIENEKSSVVLSSSSMITKKSTDVSHWSRSISADAKRSNLTKYDDIKKTTKRETSMTRAIQNSPKQISEKTQANKLSKEKAKTYKKIAKQAKNAQPLLGFDWALDAIETKLNTTSSKYDKPEEYWQELNNFRNNNKDDCISSKQTNFDGSRSMSIFYDLNSPEHKNLIDELEDDCRNHKCIHSYTLNERLFPVPVYKGKNGLSACPVCKSTKKEASSYSPQYCKISIPKSRIIEPYRIEPSKRSNVNPEDTLSLADHCVAGYQNAPKKSLALYNIPKNKTIDLRSNSKVSEDLNKLTIDDVKRIASNRDPATSDIYNKGNAMRYELEDQHLKRLRELIPKN